MTTWAEALEGVTRYEIELALGDHGLALLRDHLDAVLPGRDLWVLVEDGSATHAIVAVLTELHGGDPMELVK